MPTDTKTRQAPRVAVVGGGVSGLVAARALADDAQVTLFESETRLGGKILGLTLGDLDLSIDLGAEAFATRGGVVAAYLTELGLCDHIVSPAALGSWVMTDDRAVRLPVSGALGIPATPFSRESLGALGWAGALRAAVEPMLPRRVGNRATNLAELVRARLGRRVLDRIVRPVVLGVYSSEPRDVQIGIVPKLAESYAANGSLTAAAREVRTQSVAAGGAVAGLRGGMGIFVTTLEADLHARGVAVHTCTEVAAVRDLAQPETDASDSASGAGDARSATPRFALDAAAGEPLGSFDAVVLALPETRARAIIGSTVPPAPASDVEVIALVVDDARLDAAPRGTGVLVSPDSQSVAAKALTHVSAKWPDRVSARAPGRHVVRLSYGRIGQSPATTALDDADATSVALADASRLLGVALDPAAVRAMSRSRWRMSVRSKRGRTEEFSPLTAPIGEWVSGTGLASVIPAAHDAARDVLDALRASAPPGDASRPVESQKSDNGAPRTP